MSTDVLLAGSWVPLQELSRDDVARAALLVQVATGVGVPLYVIESVMGKVAKKEEKKELVRLAEREADRAERLAERQADRLEFHIVVSAVCAAAALLAVYLKN